MPGDPDFIPDGEFAPNPQAGEGNAAPVTHAPSVMQSAPSIATESDPDFIPENPDNPGSLPNSNAEQFGSAGQTALGVAEKIGQGLIGPLAPWLEVKSGLTTPENIRHRTEETGGLGTLGEMAGFGAGAFFGVGEAALASKIGKGAQVATGLGKGVGLGAKIAGGAVKGAAEMAALQGGEELTKLIEKDPNQTATSAATDVGMSTVLGTAMGMGFAAVPPLWTATAGPPVEKILGKIKMDWGLGNPLPGEEHIISPKLKQMLSMFGGVSKENIEAYGANREAIMAAPEFNDVYSNVLDQLTDLQENFDVKKLAVRDAQSKFDSFLKEQKLALKQAGYDAGAADALANEALKQAQIRLAQGLQDGAIEAAPKAFSAVERLKTQALEMSQSARDLLDNTPGELSLKPVFEAIRPMQDKLYSQGFPGMAEELGKQMEVFATQYGDKIGYADAKSMIQGLQKRGKWTFGANEMANGLSPYFNQLSGIMNAALKDAVPEYAKAMMPTASAFDLLGKLDKYGTPESAVKGVLGLKSAANYTNELPLLRALEESTGVKFTNQLEHYANPNVREGMIKALPEYEKSLRTAEALQELKDPQVRAALEKAPYLSPQHKSLTKAEQALQGAIEHKAGLNGLSPATLESKMKAVAAGRGLNARKAFEGVRGMDDMSIPEILDLINVREAFEKGAMNGSRNVNLWTHMVGGLGGVISGLTGGGLLGTAGGAAVGAYIGGLLDKEGPAIVRNMLDKYLNKFGDLPKALGASPEATRAGLIHFLGKDVPPDAKAFKSTVNYLKAAIKGKATLKNSANAIFQSGKVVPSHLFPDVEKTKKLDERAKHLQGNQQKMFDVGGGLSAYMPEHGAALSRATMRTVNFINQNRPMPKKMAFLDEEIEPTTEQKNDYARGLQIAQQPLMALHHIKEDSLLPQDVQILSAMHPEYYGHMKQAVTDAMTDYVSKGEKVPYSMRQGLSLFLGQELDSSFTPQNIIAAQAVFVNQKAANAQSAMNKPKGGTSKMGKISNQYRTAEQNVQARQSQNT